jgi:RNA polymerase sigma factor (sigma-70 family)
MTAASLDNRIRDLTPLVKHIAGRYSPLPGTDHDDLVQVGMLGAWAAIETFDESRGVPFEAYVAKKIQWSVVDYVRVRPKSKKRRELDTVVNVPTDMLPSKDADPLELACQQETLREVAQGLRDLPAPHRRAFVAQLNGRRVAGVTRNSEHTYVTLARRQLRKALF